MARIVVAGAGAIGATIAYHLALAGARDVVLATRRGRRRLDREGDGRRAPAVLDRGRGAARAGEHPLLRGARRSRSSTRSATSSSRRPRRGWRAGGAARAAGGARRAGRAGRPVVRRRAARRRRARRRRLPEDGIADPAAVTRELVRRAAELGVEVREGCDAATLEADTLVIACGPWSAELPRPAASSCRSGRSAASCWRPGRARPAGRPADGASRARPASTSAAAATRLVLAMTDPEPRWGFDEGRRDALRGPARAARAPLPGRGRGDDRATPGPASTT